MNKTKLFAPSPLEINESVILEGDTRQALPRLPDASVQCVVTSPGTLQTICFGRLTRNAKMGESSKIDVVFNVLNSRRHALGKLRQ